MTLSLPSYTDLAEILHASVDPSVEEVYRPRYNIAPMSTHIVLRAREGRRELVPARWGLVNYWAKDASAASHQINARSETARTRPAYRQAFERRRCVVPADGFYEWAGPKGARMPLWYHPARGGLFHFAGLYETWNDPTTGSPVRTFTILTTTANDVIAPVHDRMPAILTPEDVDTWLATPGKDEPSNAEEASALLRPAPNDLLISRPVSRRVNSVQYDGPDLLCEDSEEVAGSAAPQAGSKAKAEAKRKKAPAPQDDMPLFANIKRGA
jgi:putative SOS response-associated peptidase YedK